jgi:hypothetical protein
MTTKDSAEKKQSSHFPAPAESLRLSPRPFTLQPKLTIGQPNDKYEQEADRVAAEVVQKIHAPQASDLSVSRQSSVQKKEIQRKPTLQQKGGVVTGDASSELESSINQSRGSGQTLDQMLQAKMGQAMGADFSRVRIHTDGQSDRLSRSIQAKAFTTGQDIFFRQGAYDPGSRGGQELIAHELTHVIQQSDENRLQAKPIVSISDSSLQPLSIQRKPTDVWENSENLSKVNIKDAKYILEMDFCSNWFLAQEYLLSPDKWAQEPKVNAQEFTTKAESFKNLMKTLIKLRQSETDSLLTEVREELKKKEEFKGMSDQDILTWGSAGSGSLTSDIDVNLKGAGSIQAVQLFNRLFKSKLGWAFDPGTVYDVNVYAQDFMIPNQAKKPFVKDEQNNTIAPVQEVNALNTAASATNSASSEFTGFDAFAINQDVWSMVKMRMYMTDSEWSKYCIESVGILDENATSDEAARSLQIQDQLDDADSYYRKYQANLANKIHEIEHSSDEIYKKMNETLKSGSQYLSEHQQHASKKMMASNLIYEQKLEEVTKIRKQISDLDPKKTKESEVKKLGIQLKNALSEAIMYSNEAYFTQGAVHFSVIGQQIGGGKSTLIMSDDEHLHSFREQVGDTLKVLGEYTDVKKALLKAGKYIDRMAKSADRLIPDNERSDIHKQLATVGASAASIKSDKTKLEDLTDLSNKSEKVFEEELEAEKLESTKKEDKRKAYKEAGSKIEPLKASISQQEELFRGLYEKFKNIGAIRESVNLLAKQVEQDFRKKQLAKNSSSASKKDSQQNTPEQQQLQSNIQKSAAELNKLDEQMNI